MSARDDSLRRLDFDSLLDLLGRADGELTAVCHRPIGGPFKSSVVESGAASVGMNLLPDRACVWFSVNPVHGPARVGQGRGGEKDVTRWASLYLDVDVKDGSFPDLDKALDFVDRLSGLAGARPSAMIFSGHGVQPLWPIENGELDCEDKWVRACKLSRRFGRLAVRVAGELSASLDTVSDLSRVLRVPGTRNWKDPASPAETYAVADSGQLYPWMDLRSFWMSGLRRSTRISRWARSPSQRLRTGDSRRARVGMSRQWCTDGRQTVRLAVVTNGH